MCGWGRKRKIKLWKLSPPHYLPPSLSRGAFHMDSWDATRSWCRWVGRFSYPHTTSPSILQQIMVSVWPQKWQGGLMASTEGIYFPLQKSRQSRKLILKRMIEIYEPNTYLERMLCHTKRRRHQCEEDVRTKHDVREIISSRRNIMRNKKLWLRGMGLVLPEVVINVSNAKWWVTEASHRRQGDNALSICNREYI